MSCDISAGRLVPCKDSVGGIKNLFFVDYGKIESFVLTNDENYVISGKF